MRQKGKRLSRVWRPGAVWTAVFGLLVLFWLPAGWAGSPDTPAPSGQAISQKNPIRVGADNNYPPYEFIGADGKLQGYNIDLVRAVARAMGVGVEFYPGQWSRVRADLEQGRIDMLAGMYYSRERDRLVDFSIPHVVVHQTLFVRRDSPIDSLKDLKGKEVIVQKDDIMNDFVRQMNLTEKIFTRPDLAGALRLLASGMHDAALGSELQGRYFIERFDLDNLKPTGPPILPQDYCFAVKNGDQKLLSTLNEGLNILRATGQLQEIQKRWFGVLHPNQGQAGRILKTILLALAPLSGLILAVVLWNWFLRRKVASRTAALEKELQDRLQAEADLKESEEKYRRLFDLMSDALFLVDRNTGRILDLNGAAAVLYGYDRERMLAMNISELTANPERSTKARLEGLGNIPLSYEIKKDRTAFPAEIISGFFSWQGRSVTLMAVRDISDRIRQDQERMQLEARLRQAQKMEALGTLAGGIAHDFNNILSGIIGYTELTLLEMDSEATCRRNLENVLNAGNRARDLVKQILSFSRKSELEKKPIPVSPIVREAISLLRATLPTSVRIESRLSAEPEDLVFGDPTQIHQLLMNLGSNAADAMAEAGGTLLIELFRVDTAEVPGRDIQEGSWLCLTFRDTGPGMDPEIASRIFEPYFTTKKGGRGTGLGLSVVHGIVKGHSGNVEVNSIPGQGCTFTVLLPRIDQTETSDSPASDTPAILQGNEKILLVDDEQDVRDSARAMLERLGYTVETAVDGYTALDLFHQQGNGFDLMISDMTMPGMSGDDLVRRVKAIAPQFPVIICTGFSKRISEEGARRLGVGRLLLKPLTIKELSQAVHEVLHQEARLPESE